MLMLQIPLRNLEVFGLPCLYVILSMRNLTKFAVNPSIFQACNAISPDDMETQNPTPPSSPGRRRRRLQKSDLANGVRILNLTCIEAITPEKLTSPDQFHYF